MTSPNTTLLTSAVRRHGRKVTLITHVNSPGIGMDDSQTRIIGNQPPPQFPTLLAVQPTIGQPLECRFLMFGHIAPVV